MGNGDQGGVQRRRSRVSSGAHRHTASTRGASTALERRDDTDDGAEPWSDNERCPSNWPMAA